MLQSPAAQLRGWDKRRRSGFTLFLLALGEKENKAVVPLSLDETTPNLSFPELCFGKCLFA